MAFDGITIAAITKECKTLLLGGRINKIAQPEDDELLLTIKSTSGQYRLLLSASASLPLIYLTDKNKQSPMTAPNFCMLLRKHIQNGRIVDITQPGMERIMQIHIEHLNELGDLCRKILIVEIMGKHSNIIFCDDTGKILDSIKHVSGLISSVREVLPGREYFIPQTDEKLNPVQFMTETTASNTAKQLEKFSSAVFSKAVPLYKAIYGSFTGFSPIMAQELCYRSGLDADRSALSYVSDSSDSSVVAPKALFMEFRELMTQILNGEFLPNIVYDGNTPMDFAALKLSMYDGNNGKTFDSISQVLELYYAEKNAHTRIRQKSADLRRIVQTTLERTVKKYDLQCQQIEDTEKREKYKIYGELLHTYGYNAQPGAKSLEAENYYTGEMITIPLDPTLTASENAKKYFDRYGKLKRTYETLSELTTQVKAEIDHLESISTALDIAVQEADLAQIKEELILAGYIKRKGGGKREKITSKPFHYVSQDGFHIYVGKNNIQNEELTFKFATGNDWWFHAKGMPGSHVIVKTEGKELPDATFEDAARLAAYYSKGRGQEKVEIDYIQKKHVKKPNGGKPGFVVYYTNYSMMIDCDVSKIRVFDGV